MKYRKKPVVIEAVQWKGINPSEIKAFCPIAALETYDTAYKAGAAAPCVKITIPTLEGDMNASYGDFIIKGVNGEYYPCKPDIFVKTYEPLEKEERDNADDNGAAGGQGRDSVL